MLERGGSDADTDRRDLLVFHPDEHVQASSGTSDWMSWCVGRPWRGYQSFAQEEVLEVVPRPARETTPSWMG